MKKRFAFFICIIFVFLFAATGCKFESIQQHEANASEANASEAGNTSVSSLASSEKLDSSAALSSVAVTSQTLVSSSKVAVSSKMSVASSSKASDVASSPPIKTQTVTILINCANAVSWNKQNGNKISAAVIPANGVILKKTTVPLKEGDTVYTVLQRVTTQNKILMAVESMGSYIKSIHNLKQFQCGPESGWMFRVNGIYVSSSCSKYTLKDGDRIEWNYTCSTGRDLGQSGE